MTLLTTRVEEMSIYEGYVRCVHSFRSCHQNPHLADLSLIDDEEGRFNVWATNIGSSRDISVSSSLDYRLRNSAKTQEMVLLLLRVLRVNLDYGSSLTSNIRSLIYLHLTSNQNLR
jgi:hypothetical protein